ncbi:MAG: hypothetical protein DSZ29_06140 [Aquificaceae bacterium]|nr:MAG: hypothetical protein DSZ29_06140 [Aquificaceae bacterium]
MSNGLSNNVSNIAPLIPSRLGTPSPSNTSIEQHLAPAVVLKEKSKNSKRLSKNIETVLNKLSSNVSSSEEKAKDSVAVEDIEQDIGSILSLARGEGEGSSGDVPFGNTQIDDTDNVALKQGIVDILSIASDVLDMQTEAGTDESFTLSLIAQLLAMLEDLMGVAGDMQSSGTTSQERFNLLIKYIDLIQDDLIEAGDARFSDVINLVDQQLEEQRYRDRESMKGLSQEEYLKRKGGLN